MNKPEALGSKGVEAPATKPECPDKSGEKRVPLLRYFVLLSALAALAGCKAMKHRKGFDQKQGGGIELHDPNAGMEGGGSYLIDPSTGRIIFGEGAEKEKEPASGEAANSKPASGGAGAPKPEEAVAGGNHPKPEEIAVGEEEMPKPENATSEEQKPSAPSAAKKTPEKIKEEQRNTGIEDYIKKFLDLFRSKAPNIILPSKDTERDIKFSSSGREVTVHVKIPASHLAGIKNRLMGMLESVGNIFFGDTGEYVDEESLRKRLLAEKTATIGSSIPTRLNSSINPNWPIPVSIDDPILVELTKAVTEKFATKRGKMQAINDFAVKAIKYNKDKKRTYCKFPLLTLADGMGDCKDFSVLVATMGKIAGVDCAFVDFEPEPGGTEGHLDVACAIDGEGTAFKLDGKSYDWMKVTSIITMYGTDELEKQTNHDGIGVLSEFFGKPDGIQPVLGKPGSVKNFTDSGRLSLNEDRANWEEKHSTANKKGK